MERTMHTMRKHLKTLIEGAEEYYGYTMTKEKAGELYEVACLDPDCEQSIDIDQVKSGDVVYVSEEQDSEMYAIQIQ